MEVKVELEKDTKSLPTDPYACAIKAKHSYFIGRKIMRHIAIEFSRYVYFFLLKKKMEKFLYKIQIQSVTNSF